MERQNITLSIPRETLKKAKHLAVAKDQSLSGLLTNYIEDLVRKEEQYGKAQRQQLKLMEAGIDFGLKGAVNWAREDTHERH
ncbi:MAG: CopG family transcriptional regulator [Firmicutes bacterium]|nr:CopG family transcriptional regulator [Bacillota bacterium]